MILKNVPTLLMLFSFCYANTCIQRDYSFGSVCVCNSTYCDTAPEVSVPLPGKYDIFTSSSDGLRFNKTEGDFKSLNVTTNSTTYHINKNTTYQEILGFGGAFTDSTGINILSLSLPTQDQLLESYFSPKGIEYTIGRVPIGGTDFSTHGYTYHDNITDANLRSFNLTNEDFEFKIPLIKRAQSLSTKPLKLLASCWSPPVWMKTSKSLVGIGSLKEEYYQTYANYHVKFFDEYKKQGVEFWCVSTGNEPSTGVLPTVRINALGWTPMNQIQWIKNNFGPSMRSAHPNTCIMAIDDQRFSYPWWLDMIMQDEEASKYINGSAVHWYYDFMFPPAVLSKTHEKYPNLFLLNTESCYGSMVWDQPKVALGSWSRAESYAGDIIDSINNWVTGWVDWNLALDETGGPNWVDNFVDAPIIVNKTADEFYKQPIFYILGHFSKFITPGSLVLSGKSSVFNVIETLAVKRPDNSIAVVFLNRESFDVQLTFVDDDRGMAELNLPKHSISTMIYQ